MKNRKTDNPSNPIEVPLAPNMEWVMDFMSDSIANSRRIRTDNGSEFTSAIF
jgi:putative transposase